MSDQSAPLVDPSLEAFPSTSWSARSVLGPSHPGVAGRALAWAADPNEPPFSRLEDILMADPSLVAHILRLANSSLFGKPGRIATLAHAAALADRHFIRIASLHYRLDDSGADLPDDSFWRRSWSRSRVAGHMAAMFSSVSVDEARVAGLLAEVGQWIDKGAAASREEDVYARTATWMRVSDMPRFMSEAITAFGRSLCPDLSVKESAAIECSDTRSAELATILHLAQAWLEGFPPRISMEADELSFLADEINEDLARMDHVFAPLEQSRDELLEKTRQSLVDISMAQAHALTLRARQAEHHHRRAREYKKERDFLRTQVTLDPFLGIANRRHFDLRLSEEFKRCTRSGQSLSLILFDIDRFKQLNDTYFHQAGDEVLQSVTRAMQGCLRTTDVFARYGGEEFAVICPETDIIGGLALAERMRLTLEGLEIPHQGLVLQVTASFGLATIDEARDVGSASTLVEVADYLLYQAKKNGRNCVRHGACPHPLLPAVVGPSPSS
ncbi:GGDEF domain-containing protein [bacterium]|nr:GGDEF domain-containing protein [bacterium]